MGPRNGKISYDRAFKLTEVCKAQSSLMQWDTHAEEEEGVQNLVGGIVASCSSEGWSGGWGGGGDS